MIAHRLIVLIVLIALSLGTVSCVKRPTEVEQHQAWIAKTLGGISDETVHEVVPPAGPFKLSRVGSRYYTAVNRAGETFYVQAYISAWSAATGVLGGDAIWRYHYWRETHVPLIGKVYRSVTQ